MKRQSNFLCILSFGILFLGTSACSNDEILSLETDSSNNVSQETSLARISSTSWRVQSLGKTFSFTSEVKGRYTNDGSKLRMKVVNGDATTPGSSNPRTELRSTSADFNTRTNHSMSVSMSVIKSSTKVVIGQIFSNSLKNGNGDDLAVIFLRNKKLYAQFDGGSQMLLNNNIGSSVSFTMSTNNGTITVSGGGSSKSQRREIGGCYFKTGVYLIGGGSAEVDITNLSKN